MSHSIDSHHNDSQALPSHHPTPNPVPPHPQHPEEDLIHSQSNPQDSHSQQGTSSMSSTAKKGRGISRQISKWGKEKIHIEFDAEGQPVGKMATKLETQLGVMVRSIAPLTFTDWRSPGMEPYKERIWQEVLDNTDVPTTWRSICLQHAFKNWREYKATLKRHYDCHETDAARLSKVPPGVDPEQWKVLMEYWGCEQTQKRSATNRVNRDKQKMDHTNGRRSHPQVRHQMTIESGDESDRIKLFKKTHTKKSEEIVDSTSSYIIEQMDSRLLQIPDDEQTPESVNDVFTQILGKDGHGRVRMGGPGTCPTKVRQRQQYQVSQEQYNQMRAQITAELEEKFQAQIQSQVQIQVHAILEAMGYTPPVPDNTPQPRQPSSHGSTCGAHASTPSLEAECVRLSTPKCGHHLEIGEFVHLMNGRIPRHIVAKAIIVSIDPTKSVGGVELSNEFVEISIQKVLKPLYPLPRQFFGMRVLRDANNSKTTIPWRVSDIEKI